MATITISKVEEGTSKTGKPYLKVTDTENNWFSLWDMKYRNLAVPGATVEADIETRNNYKNILAITRTLPTPNGNASVGGMLPDDKRSRAIARQVAIKAAVDFTAGWDPADRSVAVVFDLANQIFNWIQETADDIPF